MDTVVLANILGYIAAGIGIVMFMPQAIQSFRTKNTKGISFMTFSLIAVVSVLWTIYGILLKAAPVILVNSVLFVISLFILYLKRKYG